MKCRSLRAGGTFGPSTIPASFVRGRCEEGNSGQFPQLQKYEKAITRVPASRLLRIARVLEVPIDRFFEEVDEK